MPTLTHILYIEDDLDIQSVAKIALETVGGFDLHSCSSGKEALALLQGHNKPHQEPEPDSHPTKSIPDLILLDVMMPEMDGPTTLKNLRKIPAIQTIPVIFMTAKVQTNEIAYYKSLGAIGVIAKPFDPMQLAEQVQQLWNESVCASV